MPADFDAKQWLKGLGLADDVVADIATKIADEKVLTNLKGQVLAQSDYSRAMDALRTKETKLQADADAKVQKELAEIAKYRGESDTNFQRAVDERVKAEQALISVRAQIESLARDYALPNDVVDPILKGVLQRSAADDAEARRRAEEQRRQSTELDSRYLSREEFTKQVPAWKRVPIEYQRVAGEYQSLFKSDPYLGDSTGKCAMDRIVERHEKDNVPLREAFEREFNVVAKREEVRQAEVDARVSKAVEDAVRAERTKIAAENPAAFRQANPKLPGSIALKLAGAPERNTDGSIKGTAPAGFNRASGAGGHEDRVTSAVARFNTELDSALEKSPA